MCGRCRSAMAPKRKRATTRRRKPAKRQRRMTYGQVGGVSPGLIVGIGKAGYGITKALPSPKPSKLPKNADVKWDKANGNAKQVNRLIVLSCKKRIKRPSWAWTRVSWKMVRGPNGRRHRYVPPNTTPATWTATWRRATHVGDGSLALGVQEETPTAGAPTLR